MTSREHEIMVRRIQFEYPDDLPVHWHPDKPEWSQIVNACSLLMPYLEPFLIDSVRQVQPLIEDPALHDEAKAYIGQEANHYRQHRNFNEIVISRGYEELRQYEQLLAEDYDRFRKRDLRFRLAYTAGFETMALAIGHMLVNHRRHFFEGADPAVSSLVLWHFVEELEHKTSAFYIYQYFYGGSVTGYLYRVYRLFTTIGHTVGRSRRAFRQMMLIDGLDRDWRSRWRSRWQMFRILCWSMPKVLHGALPWHRPERIPDPEWVQEWSALYDSNAGGVALLDTSRLAQGPVPTEEAST